MIGRVLGPVLVGAALAGCAATATAPHAPSAASTAAAAKIDLVALWEKAVPCPDDPALPVPTGPGTQPLQKQFEVTSDEIEHDLADIEVPASADPTAVDKDVALLRQGLTYLWWRLDVSQRRYNRVAQRRDTEDPAADDVIIAGMADDMTRAMQQDRDYFDKAQGKITTLIAEGKAPTLDVGSNFDFVCDRDRDSEAP